MQNKTYLLLKRTSDLAFSAIGIAVLIPLFILIGLFIKLDSSGPIFYLQERVGQFGKPFLIFKFRTMRANADKTGVLITLFNDDRITRVGKILRKTKLDELPQLFNVFIGNMSFVGPRPEVKKYVDHYSHEQKKVLDYKPGITDLASIKYSQESELIAKASDIDQVYIRQIMPDKIKLNLEYAEHASLAKDFMCVVRTLIKIV